MRPPPWPWTVALALAAVLALALPPADAAIDPYAPVYGTDPRDPGFPVRVNFFPLQPDPAPAGVIVHAKVVNSTLWHLRNPAMAEYTAIPFVTGANFGATKPGFNPGDLALSKEDYRRYLDQAKVLKIAVLRIYTTLTSEFYEALWEHNLAESIVGQPPILLMHGIWTPEPEMNSLKEGSNAYEPGIVSTMMDNIRTAVRAIHGTGSLAYASTRTSSFQVNVANYVLAWMLGTEWSPETVNVTNFVNVGMPAYKGVHVEASDNASPFESWVAMMMDVLAMEEMAFGSQHPLSFTNWVTTDPLRNILEPSAPVSYEDYQSIDATHMRTKPSWAAGYFIQFHIYPYYPAFLGLPFTAFPRLVNASSYPDVKNPEDPYATYMERMRTYFEGYYIIVSEVGLPTSLGSSASGFEGRDHGFLEEHAMADRLVDVLEIIRDTGWQGWILFELHDEWFKVNWNTMAVDMQRQRWHNHMSSEQFFGLIAVDETPLMPLDGDDSDWADVPSLINVPPVEPVPSAPVARLALSRNDGYLQILLKRYSGSWTSADTFIVSFDTIPDQGSATWPAYPDLRMDHAADALLVFQNGTLTVMVHSAADYYFTRYGSLYDGQMDPLLYLKNFPAFNVFRLLTKFQTYAGDWPGRYFLERQLLFSGQLILGYTDPMRDDFNNLATWNIKDHIIEARIPWMMLGFADPSNGTVFIFDGFGRELKVETTRVKAMTVQAHWVNSPPGSGMSPNPIEDNLPRQSDLIEYDFDGWEDFCYCERIKRGIPKVVAAMAGMRDGKNYSPTSFETPRDYTFCECSRGLLYVPYEVKGYIVVASFALFALACAYAGLVHPIVLAVRDLHHPPDASSFRGFARISMQVTAGLWCAGIVVGFAMFVYYTVLPATDRVFAFMSLFSEQTFNQSAALLVLFLLLLSWDSCELIFAVVFIPWSNASRPPERSTAADEHVVEATPEASIDLDRSELDRDKRAVRRQRFYFVVACHNSSRKLQRTLTQLLKLVPPHQIVIADNGSTREEERTTDEICAALTELYRREHPDYAGDGIKVGHIGEGSKTSAQLSAVYNLHGVADFVTMMDDDTFVPDGFDMEDVLARFERDDAVQCVGYCLRATKRVRWLEVLEDLEYLIASFMKTTQARLGTALFASGAINTWRTETVVDVLFRHDTMHHGDDLQQGLIMHSLAGKPYFLYPGKVHTGNYKVDVSSNVVFTDVPVHWMHLTDFIGDRATPCTCDEPSLLHQRGKGWDVSRQRFVLKYIKMLVSMKRVSWNGFFSRVVAAHDLLIVLNDWVSTFYLIALLIILPNRLLILLSFVVSWAIQILAYFSFAIFVLYPKGIEIPPEALVVYPILYKLPSQMFLRFYAMLYNIFYYLPFVRNKATIKRRLRQGDTNPIRNMLSMSRTWHIVTETFHNLAARGGPHDDMIELTDEGSSSRTSREASSSSSGVLGASATAAPAVAPPSAAATPAQPAAPPARSWRRWLGIAPSNSDAPVLPSSAAIAPAAAPSQPPSARPLLSTPQEQLQPPQQQQSRSRRPLPRPLPKPPGGSPSVSSVSSDATTASRGRTASSARRELPQPPVSDTRPLPPAPAPSVHVPVTPSAPPLEDLPQRRR